MKLTRFRGALSIWVPGDRVNFTAEVAEAAERHAKLARTRSDAALAIDADKQKLRDIVEAWPVRADGKACTHE